MRLRRVYLTLCALGFLLPYSQLLWTPVVAVLAVGVSLALPLFLYLRQTHLDRN